MKNKNAFSNKEWFEIPGFDGFYEVNVDGEVRTWKKPGKCIRANEPRMLKLFKVGTGTTCLRLKKSNGESADISIARIMANVFLGGVPEGKIAYHKDGNQYNTCLYNIGITTREEMGKICGKTYNRKPVLRVDREGNVLDVYKSVTEAAKKSYMNRAQVEKHLKKKVKNPFMFQNWTFIYDED